MADTERIEQVVHAYLDGDSSKENAAQELRSLLSGPIAESSGEEQRLGELMDAVQPETTWPCVMTVSAAVCTSNRLCD